MQDLSTITPTVTIGIELGDRVSRYCVLDEGGSAVDEGRLATNRAAFRVRFAGASQAAVREDRHLGRASERGSHAVPVEDEGRPPSRTAMVARSRRSNARAKRSGSGRGPPIRCRDRR